MSPMALVQAGVGGELWRPLEPVWGVCGEQGATPYEDGRKAVQWWARVRRLVGALVMRLRWQLGAVWGVYGGLGATPHEGGQ
jgi:hypothetical protein